jgi:hypothetical protein
MSAGRNTNPALLSQQLELLADKLAVRPGPLPERLADIRYALFAISPGDFPTNDLAREWAAIQAAMTTVDEAASNSEQAACEIACALLDFRTRLREWVAERQATREGTAA